MVDPSALSGMTGFIQSLPLIMNLSQIMIYIVFILFFGSIAVRGYKGHLHWGLHFLLRLGTGLAALIAGIALSGFLPLGDSIIVKIVQLDLILGGIIASVVLLIALYILTLRFSRRKVLEKKILDMQSKLTRTKDRSPSKLRLDPFIVVGILIIIIFLAFAVLNFQGFPNPLEDMLSSMGVDPDILSQLGEGGLEGLLPEGMVIEGKPLSQQSAACTNTMSTIVAMQSQLTDPAFLAENTYTDEAAKASMEADSGKTVLQMFKVEQAGKETILAVTEDQFTCVAVVPYEFCLCLGYSS